MSLSHAARRSVALPLFVAIVVALQAIETIPVSRVQAVSANPPTNLEVLGGPDLAYAARPFDVFVRMRDQFIDTVTEGTVATVTLSIASGPVFGAVLACPGGLSQPTGTSGATPGTVTFRNCTIDQVGSGYFLRATASSVVSNHMPTPVVAPDDWGPVRVAETIDAPQHAITLTVNDSPHTSTVAVWGRPVTLRVVFSEHGVNEPFQLQAARRTEEIWRPIADLMTDQNGFAIFSHQPIMSTTYRAVFQGNADLAKGSSAQVSVLLHPVARQRPMHATARVIQRGTTIRFTTTVTPVAHGPVTAMKVGFQIYHRVAGHWKVASLRTRPVDAAGVARINITFGSAGDWYVRSYAKGQLASNVPVDPDLFLVAMGQSSPTSIARFRVR